MIRPEPTPGTSALSRDAGEPWGATPDRAIAQAISKWNLDQVGWRGFEALPWVEALHARLPDVKHIAQTASSHNGRYKDEVQALVLGLDRRDYTEVRAYFVGKLALEELSCRRSGAGAGLCDKRTAFLDIFERLKTPPPVA